MRAKWMLWTVAGALLLGTRARAWDAAGHMQVADIAWTKLTRRTRTQIAAILMAGDPRYRPVSRREADLRDAFRRAAVYADTIKGDRTTQYEEIIPKMNALLFVKTKPDPTNREDELCKTWHYFDTPIRDRLKRRPPQDSNALAALELARRQLTALESMPAPDRRMQAWWLYWTEHLVGDLHQPLHCVSSFEFSYDGDAGGNKLLVITDPAKPDRRSRLHGYWDGGIARAIGAERLAGLSPNVEAVSRRWTADPTLKPSAREARDLNVAAWISEGARQADTVVYNGLQPDEPLPAGYAEMQILLCKRQAVLAGMRLAHLLNTELDKRERTP